MIYFRKVLVSSLAATAFALLTVSFDALSEPLVNLIDTQPIAGLDIKATELKLFNLSEALLQDPQNPQLLLQKGIHLSDMGKLQAAFDIFDSLRASFPEQAAPYVNLAALYARWGKLEEARDMLMKSSTLQKNRLQTHISLASVNVSLALESLAKALEINPGDANTQAKLQALEKFIAQTDKDTTHTLVQSSTGVLKNQGAAERSNVKATHNRVLKKQQLTRKPMGDRLVLEDIDAYVSDSRSVQAKADNPAINTANGLKADVLTALQSWVKAWSSKSFEAYASHYSTAFTPADGSSIEAWQQRKKTLLGTAKFIQVDTTILDVTFDGPVATVRMQQTYQSDRYSDKTRKNVRLRLEGGRWKLLSEEISN